MIFGESLFADGLLADGITSTAPPPILPPAGQAWDEQCPITSNFNVLAQKSSAFSGQTKQDSTWTEQSKNTIPTNKCETS